MPIAANDDAEAARLAESAAFAPELTDAAPAFRELDALLDRLTEEAAEFHPAALAEYRTALDEVIALDPDLLSYEFGRPVVEMDEAAMGLFVSAWGDGLRRGAAIGLGLLG